jgi:ferredoxin
VKPEDAERLIFNDDCRNNTAVYLTKKEIIGDDKIAIVATHRVLKSILQLDKENQINHDNLLVFTVGKDGEVIAFDSYEVMAQYVADNEPAPDPKVLAKIEKIDKMSREERWAYWKSEMAKCIRCYACRAACPLCYCNRCITEVNCPQWIDPWNSTLSNMEWQINRVMHMSGRCTGCGACADACPLDLPIGLLTKKMAQDIKSTFGTPDEGNVLSTFNPNDKENFIH